MLKFWSVRSSASIAFISLGSFWAAKATIAMAKLALEFLGCLLPAPVRDDYDLFYSSVASLSVRSLGEFPFFK